MNVVEALRQKHWLMFQPGTDLIVGCHCGFVADQDYDCGLGDSVVVHFFEVTVAAMQTTGGVQDHVTGV